MAGFLGRDIDYFGFDTNEKYIDLLNSSLSRTIEENGKSLGVTHKVRATFELRDFQRPQNCGPFDVVYLGNPNVIESANGETPGESPEGWRRIISNCLARLKNRGLVIVLSRDRAEASEVEKQLGENSVRVFYKKEFHPERWLSKDVIQLGIKISP